MITEIILGFLFVFVGIALIIKNRKPKKNVSKINATVLPTPPPPPKGTPN